jgi:hypothetical protein
MKEDPDELNDLINHPDYQEIAQKLEEEVLDGWDPQGISDQIDEMKKDYDMVEAWATKINPVSQYYWQLDPAMDYLDKYEG